MQNKAVKSKALDYAILGVSLGLLLYLASYAFLLWESPNRLVLIMVPIVLSLWILTRIKKGSFFGLGFRLSLVVGAAMIAVLAYSGYYFFRDFQSLQYERAGINYPMDYALGAFMLVLVLVASWIDMGKAIPTVLFVFMAYAFLGKYLPYDNVLYHAGVTWKSFMRFAAIGPDGVLGGFVVTGFTLVLIFLFFAGIAQGTGGLSFIINFSRKITGRFTWGLPQIPVVASMFFGTFSGSAAANVAGTGSFTIPMMKSIGVPPKIAGAIEAVSSSGGQIMPPVMGVAAFLMADFLGMRYIDIVIMGFPPAFIFYVSVAFSVYLLTKDIGISRATSATAAQKLDKLSSGSLADGLPLVVAIIVLMVFLVAFMASVLIAGFWMVVTYLACYLLLVLYRARFSLSAIPTFLKTVGGGIRDGAVSAVQLTCLLGIMNLVARLLVTTGLGQKLSFMMVDLSHGQILPLLALILVVSVLLGMAVSTVVVYIVVALLAAPALTSWGIEPYVSHFMVFYLAMLSSITPPVAIAVVVACAIAKSSYFATGWQAMRIGVALFVMPFVFLFKPDILAVSWGGAITAFAQAAVGLLAVTYGIHSRWGGLRGWSVRVLFIAMGLFVCFWAAGGAIVWAGVALILLLGALVFLATRRRARMSRAGLGA